MRRRGMAAVALMGRMLEVAGRATVDEGRTRVATAVTSAGGEGGRGPTHGRLDGLDGRLQPFSVQATPRPHVSQAYRLFAIVQAVTCLAGIAFGALIGWRLARSGSARALAVGRLKKRSRPACAIRRGSGQPAQARSRFSSAVTSSSAFIAAASGARHRPDVA